MKIIKIYMLIFMMVFCYQSIVFAEEPDIVKRYKNVYDGKKYKYDTKNSKGLFVKWKVKGKGKKLVKLSKKTGKSTEIFVQTNGEKVDKVVVEAVFYKKLKNGKYKIVSKKTDTINIKVSAKNVRISNKISNLNVNQIYDFNRKITPKNATSKVYWTVTTLDNKTTKNAKINEKGVFKATKSGEYIVKAVCKNTKKSKIKCVDKIKVVVNNKFSNTGSYSGGDVYSNNNVKNVSNKSKKITILGNKEYQNKRLDELTNDELEVFLQEFDEYVKNIDTKDDDGDGLINHLEKMLGTDPNKVDTDGDGLSDFFEYMNSLDPTKVDTDGNGISDADEDMDKDGLTNLEEFKLGTDPRKADSDYDGINDYDEVKVYKTNPLEQDTDSDGISDKKEIELGLNPNSKYTKKGELDSDKLVTIVEKPKEHEIDKRVIPTIKMTVPAKMIETLSIDKVDGKNIYLPDEMPGYIGSGYDFYIDGTFDKAELSFKFDKKLLNDKNFEPAIYYCNEEKQEMELIETKSLDRENGVITADITHFSKYILLDKNKFESVFEFEDDFVDKNIVGVIIDFSSNEETREILNSLKKYVNNSFIGSFVGDYTGNLLNNLISDKELKKTVDNSVLPYVELGLEKVLDEIRKNNISSKYEIYVTYEDMNNDYKFESKIVENGKTISTLCLGEDVDKEAIDVAINVGDREYFIDNDFIKVFNIKRETIDYEKDSDNDGISDYYENLINTGKIRFFNGVKLNVDPNNPDTDGDGLLDGQEMQVRITHIHRSEDFYTNIGLKSLKKPSKKKKNKSKLADCSGKSLFNKKDSEGDGIPDNIDKEPLKWNVTDRHLLMASDISYNRLPLKTKIEDFSPSLKNNLNEKFDGNGCIDELNGFEVIDKYTNEIKYIMYNYSLLLEETHIKSNGLYVLVLKNEDNIIVACRGTQPSTIEDIKTDAGIYKNGTSGQTKEIKNYMKDILKDKITKNTRIYTTGHSLGGNLAYNAGAMGLYYYPENIKGIVTFNGLGLCVNRKEYKKNCNTEEKIYYDDWSKPILQKYKNIIRDYVIYCYVLETYQCKDIFTEYDYVYSIPKTEHFGKLRKIKLSDIIRVMGLNFVELHNLKTFYKHRLE